MREELAKALSLKTDRKFSKTRCFIEFKDEQVNLYMGRELHSFPNLHEMYEFLAKKHMRFYIFTNDLDMFIALYKDYPKKKYRIDLLKVGGRVFGLNVANTVSFRDMKYKYGSNRFSTDAALEIINKDTTDIRTSFTSNLGRLIEIDAVKEKFQPITKSLR